mmetsp:Transcript_80691/g.193535  ORF Transcript_80691/g.193535 Transcript_80691/m.193535 type:complete len:217 (+) Transcript_80691:2429-3079(+)
MQGRGTAVMRPASWSRATNAGRLVLRAAHFVVTLFAWRGRPVMMGTFSWRMAATQAAKWRMAGHAARISTPPQTQHQCVHRSVVTESCVVARPVMMETWCKVTAAIRTAPWRIHGFAAIRLQALQAPSAARVSLWTASSFVVPRPAETAGAMTAKAVMMATTSLQMAAVLAARWMLGTLAPRWRPEGQVGTSQTIARQFAEMVFLCRVRSATMETR